MFVAVGLALLLINLFAKQTILLALGPLLIAIPSLFLAYTSIRTRLRADLSDLAKIKEILAAEVQASLLTSQGVNTDTRRRNELGLTWQVSTESSDSEVVVQKIRADYVQIQDAISSDSEGSTPTSGSGGAAFSRALRFPPCRLVMLGHAGAGKSRTLLHATLSILATRKIADPVPVLLDARGWSRPSGQGGFRAWLANEVSRQYRFSQVAAKRLVDGHHLALLFDGFDEIPEFSRHSFIEAMNDYVSVGDMLALASRPEAYPLPDQRLNRKSDLKIDGAQAVELAPLSREQVEQYLALVALEADMEKVQAAMGANPLVYETIRRPLYLALLARCLAAQEIDSRAVMNGIATAQDRASIEQLLVESYFRSVLSDRRLGTTSYRQRAYRWLQALARLQEDSPNRVGALWWSMTTYIRRYGTGLTLIVPAVVSAVVGLLFATHDTSKTGVLAGLGLWAGLSIASFWFYAAATSPIASMGYMSFFFGALITNGLGIGILVATCFGFSGWARLAISAACGAIAGLCLTGWISYRISRITARPFDAFWFFLLPILAGTCLAIRFDATTALVTALVSTFAITCWTGSAFGGFYVEYLFWPITYLLSRGDAPLRLTRFFEWAVQAGILKHYGRDAYQFNHSYLHEFLRGSSSDST